MDVYEKLRRILDAHPTGAPPSTAFDRILRILFSPEEAGLATHMNFAPKAVDAIASAAGLSPSQAETMLENMAGKATIFSREKDGRKYYGLLPTIPGLFEFPLMKGRITPVHDELAGLWNAYHDEGLGASFAGKPTPVARVVPVEQALDGSARVHPYEEVAKLIDEVDFIALAQCACRVSVRACDAPTETCLFFDAPARFLAERGYAREITREEAREVLDRAETAGLVHTSGNSADRAAFICNCCPCCCTILTCQTKLGVPHGFATSGFQARVDGEACTGCGICADDRCPMGAIEMVEDMARVHEEVCIGCGLCVTGCPADAMVLERRTAVPEVPATVKDMAVRVLKEKGKLKDFMEVMKK